MYMIYTYAHQPSDSIDAIIMLESCSLLHILNVQNKAGYPDPVGEI